MNRRRFVYGAVLLILPAFVAGCSDSSTGLLNVSYDPTRELWKDLNRAFAKQYADRHGSEIKIEQSHGGSSTQARSVIDGLEADVVTLAMWQDTDAIRKKGLIKEGLGGSPAESIAAVHFDDRVRRSQGKPEGHQGLERSGARRTSRSSRRTRRPRATAS